MIFAAGFGTRMRPLTDSTPKPLIQVGGQSLLDHTVGLIKDAGLTPSVVNAHYLSDQIEAHFENDPHTRVITEQVILDTGGGLKNAATWLSGDVVITTNADNIWAQGNPFITIAHHWTPDAPACLLCAHKDQVHGRDGPGDFELHHDGRLTRGGDFVFLGVQIIDKRLVTAVPQDVFSLNVVWDDLIKQGKLFGAVFDGVWCDVGRPENIELAAQILDQGRV